MILSLLATIVVEGAICLSYSIWCKKPLVSILGTSIFANLITQSLLWIALHLFVDHYLATLFLAELLIWLIESILLCAFRVNRLGIREASVLSLLMNLTSFGLGWFLPI